MHASFGIWRSPFRIIVTLQKYFSHPSWNCLLFSDPTLKTEMGTAIRWERLIANHLDQSLWLANQKHGAPVRSYLLRSSQAGACLCCTFYQPYQTEPICRRKIIFLSQAAICWLFSSNFNLQGHVLSTSGDALTKFHSFKNICRFQSQAVFFFCGEYFRAEFLGSIVCWLRFTLISSWVPSWVTILFIYGRSHIDSLIIKCFGTLGTPPKKHLFEP